MLKYIYAQNIYVMAYKNANILQKGLKWFLIFMMCAISTKHCNLPYDWNKFVDRVKSLIIIISQINIF
jgi:GT2 family glycosyltransferase